MLRSYMIFATACALSPGEQQTGFGLQNKLIRAGKNIEGSRWIHLTYGLAPMHLHGPNRRPEAGRIIENVWNPGCSEQRDGAILDRRAFAEKLLLREYSFPVMHFPQNAPS